ncbi:MAG: TlpA family protein disulfide reductase [Anaerolineales bacterium]|jgi:thiol-disulfide isomerase/thioredoxin|nr:TlpA family protein disulfide reductase [Anaerolineales bacterium]
MKTKSYQNRIGKSKRSPNLLRWGIPLFLIIGVAATFTLSRTPFQNTSQSPQSGSDVDDIAPDFSVPTLDGKTFVLSENQGKPTIILFMAYWCGNCIPEARALAQLQKEYGDRINIIALDIDASSTAESLEQFKQAAGNGVYVWAFDPDFEVASSYQVNALDTTLILDAKGIIVYRDQVPSTYDALKSELEKLLP